MANVKFSEFPSAATVGGTDIIPIVQGGINKKATGAVFSTYIGSAFVALTGNQTIAGVKTFSSQLVSTIATGTAPFSVASTTKVTNLNADLLDGLSSAAFQTVLTNPITGTGTTNYLPKFTGSSALGDSLIFDNGTNIGIGTATPSAKLELGSGNIRLTNTAQIEWGGGANSIDASNATNVMRFYTNNLERININSAGYIGIGTATAFSKLSIAGAGGSLSAVSAIQFYDSNSGGSRNFAWSNGAGGNQVDLIGKFILSASSAVNGDALTGNALMAITGSGNVGIGTTAPATKLQVDGADYSFIAGSDVGNRRVAIGLDVSGEPSIQGTLSNGTARQISINPSGGNVGIGTYAPTEELEVYKSQNGITRLLVNNPDTTNANSRAAINVTSGAVVGEMVAITGLGLFLGTATNQVLSFITNGSSRMDLTTTGNLLIGTTTDAGYKLQVAGLQQIKGSNTLLNFGELDTNNVYFQALNLATSASKGFIFYGTTEYMRIKSSGVINISNIPTSATGLSAGDIWSDGGTLKIV
jgi:hypothetical protein